MADDAPARESALAMLDRMSVEDLTALIEAATVKRREKQDEAKATMLAKWKAEAAAAGLSLDALLPGLADAGKARKARKDQGGSVPAKYRGPNGEEWSGRGRTPKWLSVMEAEGKSRDQFKI
jgi:DNA-binding protein H-NS